MRRFLFRGMAMGVLGLVGGIGVAEGVEAQVVTSEIRGTVTDTNGQPLSGVRVTVTDLRTNISRGAVTNQSGRYFVSQLQPGGPYAVAVELIGYRSAVNTEVRISLSQAETVNFELEQTAVEVAGLTIAVDPAAALFSQSRTGQSTRIGETEIETFPTVQRNIMDLTLLSPYANLFEDAPSIAGKANRFNNIQIDGAVNNDVFGVGESGTPGGQANAKPITLEAIEEFQILVAPFDVRHSNFSGGLVNAVTKSGTNEWDFSAFGLFSNENFVSSLEDDEFGAFSDNQIGGTIGGPLIRDRLFFFGAAEFQRADEPSDGFEPGQSNDLTQSLGINPSDAVEIADIFRDTYGIEPGTTGTFSTENPRTNLFGRIDYQLGEAHRLVVRHNYAKGDNDLSCNRGNFGEYCFTTNLAPFTSTTNSTVLELFSQLGDTWENEVLVNAEFIREERDPAVSFGQVAVEASIDFLAGAERFSQANSLDQDIFQFTDNLTGRFGDHRVTFGTHNEFYSFNNLFEPAIMGVWTYGSIADFAANTPNNYVRRVPVAGVSESELPSDFSVAQLGFYVQDEWTVSDQLTLTAGLRAEIPIFPDDPRENPDFEAAFGRSNTIVPSNVVWQPRIGFNYQTRGEYLTQYRGGIGLFAGRSPFVWISNAYGNTGRQSVDLECQGDNAPAFTPGTSPTTCVDGSGAAQSTPIINVIDEDFKFPLDLKISAGVDRELPGGFTGGIEVLYSKAVEEAFFEELNLVSASGTDPVEGRPFFGTPTAAGCGSRGGCFTDFRRDADFGQVVNLTNRGESKAFFLTFLLAREFSEWLRVRGSYTYADVQDLQVQQSSQATSNFGRNAIRGHPNNPELTDGSYEVENKVVLAATARWDFSDDWFLEVTPTYFGQSGLPYAYVVRGDPNGDGYRDAVISRDNDLIYIPNDVSELAWLTPGDADQFEALINSDSCLSSQRGSLMRRASCRNPWNHSLNLQFVIGLPGTSGGDLELVGIVQNIFESKFEQSDIDRGIEALRVAGREGGVANGRFIYDYRGPTPGSDGKIDPFDTFTPESNRFFQLGLRYRY